MAEDDDWETADLSRAPGGPARNGKAPTILARPPVASPNSSTAPSSSGEDEWFRPKAATNRQIWDNANRAAPTVTSIAAPPPRMQILKRPANSGRATTPNSSSGTATPTKTLTQREEEYRLARERIFGPDSGTPGSTSSTGGGSGSNSPAGGSSVVGLASAPNPDAMNTGSVNATPPHSERGDRERHGRRSGSSTPRSTSGRGSPRTGGMDELTRGVDRMSVGGGVRGPPGPVPLLRGASPGVLRQPRGPGQGGGFASTGPGTVVGAGGAGAGGVSGGAGAGSKALGAVGTGGVQAAGPAAATGYATTASAYGNNGRGQYGAPGQGYAYDHTYSRTQYTYGRGGYSYDPRERYASSGYYSASYTYAAGPVGQPSQGAQPGHAIGQPGSTTAPPGAVGTPPPTHGGAPPSQPTYGAYPQRPYTDPLGGSTPGATTPGSGSQPAAPQPRPGQGNGYGGYPGYGY